MKDQVSQPSGKWGDLGVRTASAVVLAPLALLVIWQGGAWFTIMAAFLGVLLALEWTDIAHARSPGQFALHALAALCAVMLPVALGIGPAVLAIIVLAVLSNSGVTLAGRTINLWTSVGVPYVALPIFALVILRGDPAFGMHAIFWLVLVVWAADILAYFAGRFIGGPKLAPGISPKKTWAGLGGAIVGAALASGLYALQIGVAAFPLVAIAAVLAVVEQGGDIFESSLKRHHGVKDSGTLIPGHGGILDRVDGLLAVALTAGIIGYLHNPLAPATGLLAW